MDFIFPKFSSPTHVINNSLAISINYPTNNTFRIKRDYQIPEGVQVVVIQENLGYKCSWSQVKVIDFLYESAEYFDKTFYILNEYITNIGSKKTFKAICTSENEIDINAQEIDPTLKDTFIPYIDKKNGLYSVRIQTDYERILDSYVFDKLLQDVFYEGMSLLLASRGFRSDNDTITNFLNEYNTFGYINKDLDTTVLRPCEPLTFTVSLPLRFFNNFESNSLPNNITQAPRKINFNNKNFVELMNNILYIFKRKAADFFAVTYPNKFIENFNVDYEILRIKNFAKTASSFFDLAGYPIISDKIFDYEIGFDITANETSKILYIKIKTGDKEVFLSQAFLSQFRLTGELNSLRIFNYIQNIDNMRRDLNTLNILDFIKLYIKYPNANLVDEKIVIGNQNLTPEKIKSYRESYNNLKNCVSVADLGKGIDEALRLTDTIYYLFIENEEEKNREIKTSYEGLRSNGSDLAAANADFKKQSPSEENFRRKFTTQDGDIIYYPETIKDISVFAELTKISNISTLSYMLNRMNITKFLMQHMFCYLKGLPSNSREAIELIARISPDLINYFTYLYNIRKYRGREWARLVAESSKNFNFDLFCNSSQQVIYFIKALAAISKGINAISTQIVQIENTLASKNTVNPYRLLTNQIVLTIQRAYSDYLTNLMSELFSNSCEDDLLNPSPNFQDPFKSHIPIEINGRNINNDEQVVKNNTRDALDETFAGGVINNLTFGFDREYTVDLLQQLFNDIKCILTPNEIIDLLQNRANDLTIVIIKNIIRNKYSEDPNNLLFLTENDQALKLFFQRFGQKIDPIILENIETTIGDANELIGTSLCKDEFADTRQKIIEGKLPPELGVLEDQIAKRVKKARNILEYVTNDTAVINVSLLCPDNDSEEGNIIKDTILENYNKYIDNLFSDVLISFNENASLITNKLLELKSYGFNSQIFKYLAAYPTFSYNFDGYIQGRFLLQENYDIIFNDNKNTELFPDKFALGFFYVPDSREAALEDKLANFVTISKDDAISNFVFCQDKDYKIDPEFARYITRNNFFLEFVREDYFFDEEGDLDDSREELEQDEKIRRGIAPLEKLAYFISITFDREFGSAGTDDIIQFRLYVNNLASRKYEIVKTETFKGRIEGLTITTDQGFDFFTTDSVYNSFQTIIKWQTEREIARATGQTLFNTRLPSGWEPDSDIIYKLQFYDKDYNLITQNQNIATLGNVRLSADPGVSETQGGLWTQLLNDIFVNKFKDSILEIEKFNELVALVDKFKQFGLFQNFISFDPDKDSLLQKILVSTTVSKEEIELKEFININIPSEEKDFFKNLYKSLLYSNIAQKKIYQTSNPPPNDVYTQFLPNTYEDQFLIISHKYSEFLRTKLIDNFLLSSPNEEDEVTKYRDEAAATILGYETAGDQYRRSVTQNGSRATLLKFSLDSRYKNCNIIPHYLNLNFFKQRAFNNAKELLCDDYITEAPDAIIKEIIVNMTVRTFVTDILTKGLIFFNLLDIETLEKIHKNKYFTSIVYEFVKKELQTYGTRQNNSTIYYEKFLKIVEEIYDKYLQNGVIYGINDDSFISIKKEFAEENKCLTKEEKLLYFIKKEIRHFIYYALSKSIIKPAEVSAIKQFLENISEPYYIGPTFIRAETLLETLTEFLTEKDKQIFIGGENAFTIGATKKSSLDEQIDKRRISYPRYTVKKNAILEFFGVYDDNLGQVGSEWQLLIKNKYTEKLFEYLFFFYFSHFVMANTIDADRRNIFSSTKSELVSLFYLLIPFTAEENPEDINLEDKTQEDVIQFLRNLSYTPNPAILLNIAPDYAKYIDFAAKALITTSRTILLNVAQSTDTNIAVTRAINTLITTVASTAWGLTAPETRQKLIVESKDIGSVLLWKKLEDGRPLVSDAFLSVPLLATVPYTQPFIATAYLIVDSIAEGIYLNESLEELKKLREQYSGEGKKLDPCETEDQQAQAPVTAEFTCTADKQQKLIKEIDAYEESPKLRDEIITKPPVC